MTYPGGKNADGVYQRIINLMPPHKTYIEPFAGSGAILRMKRPAEVNIAMDLNRSSIERLIQHLAPAETPRTAERDRATPKRASGAGGGSALPLFQIHVGDGIEYLRTYKFDGSELVYCDPPYLMSSRSYQGAPLYVFECTDAHHRDLLKVLKSLPCMVILSAYENPMYSRSLKKWNHITFQAMTHRRQSTEWLWFNFPKPTELHDYRFLGENFRERERINRKKKRWAERLKNMPALERQALLAAIQGDSLNG